MEAIELLGLISALVLEPSWLIFRNFFVFKLRPHLQVVLTSIFDRSKPRWNLKNGRFVEAKRNISSFARSPLEDAFEADLGHQEASRI